MIAISRQCMYGSSSPFSGHVLYCPELQCTVPAERREGLGRLDLPDARQPRPDVAQRLPAPLGRGVLDVRVLARLAQRRHRVQLAVQVGDLLGDVADLHLVLRLLQKRERDEGGQSGVPRTVATGGEQKCWPFPRSYFLKQCLHFLCSLFLFFNRNYSL